MSQLNQCVTFCFFVIICDFLECKFLVSTNFFFYSVETYNYAKYANCVQTTSVS